MNLILVIKDLFSCKPKVDNSWKGKPLKVKTTFPDKPFKYAQGFPVNSAQI